jgi:hypothetical protein
MVVEGTKESHMDKKTTPLPPNVKLHEWEIPEETIGQTESAKRKHHDQEVNTYIFL